MSRLSTLLKKKRSSTQTIEFLGEKFQIITPTIIELQTLEEVSRDTARRFAEGFHSDDAESLKKQKLTPDEIDAFKRANPDQPLPANKYVLRTASTANMYYLALMVCELLHFESGEKIVEGASKEEINQLQNEILKDITFFQEFTKILSGLFSPKKGN